jgi:hypothetical protein
MQVSLPVRLRRVQRHEARPDAGRTMGQLFLYRKRTSDTPVKSETSVFGGRACHIARIRTPPASTRLRCSSRWEVSVLTEICVEIPSGARAEFGRHGRAAAIVEVRNARVIPGEITPMLFQPFAARGDRKRHREGLGLGLFISGDRARASRRVAGRVQPGTRHDVWFGASRRGIMMMRGRSERTHRSRRPVRPRSRG